MMTTNLTHGRPYRLPFEQDPFYFDPREFRELFPERVVAWMEQHPRKTDEPSKFAPILPMPSAQDLPVVVGVRMSLSFPLLISAVPLHAVDYGLDVPEQERKPERCWFSDGGICSNFPVHFFDEPLPRRPTFAVNLREFHPDRPRREDERQNSWMVESNRGGILEWWSRLGGADGGESVTGFVGLIVNALQNWRDNTQLRYPGYRDRIVHVGIASCKGGLNLTMPPERVKNLSKRGADAAEKLLERFAPGVGEGHELSWDNHRWVRYRTTMSGIEQLLMDFATCYHDSGKGERSYQELIDRAEDAFPKSYRLARPEARVFAAEATKEVVALAEKWQAQAERFSAGAPNPHPRYRGVPDI
jgi:hypothetical protein